MLNDVFKPHPSTHSASLRIYRSFSFLTRSSLPGCLRNIFQSKSGGIGDGACFRGGFGEGEMFFGCSLLPGSLTKPLDASPKKKTWAGHQKGKDRLPPSIIFGLSMLSFGCVDN